MFLLTCLRKYYLTLLLLVYGYCSPAQQINWDSKSVQLANTAINENYLNEGEKELILYINLLRLEPKTFLKKIVLPYLDSAKIRKSKYTTTLIKTLETTKPLSALNPDEILHKSAKSHAEKSGKKGTSGHQLFDKRLSQYNNGYKGENCSYGYENPIDIIMQLLIDEGVNDYGHRKNLLLPNYNYIGVAIRKHKKYEWNCVMDFGS